MLIPMHHPPREAHKVLLCDLCVEQASRVPHRQSQYRWMLIAHP
jgi:hypothetical protein